MNIGIELKEKWLRIFSVESFFNRVQILRISKKSINYMERPPMENYREFINQIPFIDVLEFQLDEIPPVFYSSVNAAISLPSDHSEIFENLNYVCFVFH